jgi:alkylation response protein AidB-like acyl-CoA dehydrogenase
MDFELSEDQASIAELAATILGDLCTPESLRAHEQSGDPTLEKAWAALASADLLGVALPESVGGGGYGVLEACLVAEQVGRHVAPVPYAATLASSLALAGVDAASHEDLLRGVIEGDIVLAPALSEGSTDTTSAPATTATTDGRLTGEKRFVPWAAHAVRLLVPATGEGGEIGLFLVDPAAGGVTITAEDAMWGLPQATVELAGAAGARVGGAGAVRQLERIATALACATVAGVCEGALRITAAHVSEREQFGTKIGTFQAVAQRIADAYIDTQGVRLTAIQAAWRLAEGLPADEELHIAKFWATEGGHRVGHAAQHLHGGVGVDVDYPVHRYFRWAKVLEFELGSGTEHLRRLGALLAAEPV